MTSVKKNDIIHKLFLTGLLMAMVAVSGVASEKRSQDNELRQDGSSLIEEVEAEAMAQAILNRYVPWKNAEFSGRIRLAANLPVTPSIKLYLERDSLIQISIRAAFLGELGRIEITPTTFLAVNKYNRNYCRESTTNVINSYPDFISDIQSLLLGRIVLLGKGELNPDNLGDVILQKTDDGEWILFPADLQEASGKAAYGYVVMPNGRTGSLYATLEGRPENVLLQYIYQGSGMALGINVTTPKKQVTATLDFDTVRWGGTPMSPVNLSSYQKLGIQEFVKAFKL